ncbi:MAG: hypothetical protein JWP93_2240 [Polaromonas sp.]|nr:hypothetical protein [Polaromonas sp.]
MPWPAFRAPSSAASSAGGGALAQAAQQRASQYAGVSQARTTRSRRGQHASALALLVFFPCLGWRYRRIDRCGERVAEVALTGSVPPAKGKRTALPKSSDAGWPGRS